MDEREYQETVSRVENWGRWARSGGVEAKGRCGSIEGRYLREKLDEEKLQRDSRMPIDVEDAVLVEAAVLKLRGRRLRSLIIGRFVYGYGKEEMCRKLGIEWGVFEACVIRGVYEVRAQLGRARRPEPRAAARAS